MVSRKVPWGGKDVGGSSADRPDLEGDRPGENGDSPPSQRTQSAVTNGTRILPGIDGRSPWARRVRDVQRALISDLGGRDRVTAAELALCRRAAVLVTQLELIEARMAEGDTSATAFDHYCRGSGVLKRLLEVLGIQRRVAKDITRSSALIELLTLEGKIKPEGNDDHE